jgi:hypothetical protein
LLLDAKDKGGHVNKFRKGCLTKTKIITGWGFFLFMVIIGYFAFINLNFSDRSSPIDTLSQNELIRLQEVNHLRTTLGNEIWPGFGEQDIPVILYNEAYVFLSGLDATQPGWKTVPFFRQMGSQWSSIGSDSLSRYYRQPIKSSDQIPEAFTVQVGDKYVASMTTKQWTGIKLTQLIKNEIPAFLRPVFPYSVIRSKFNSDWHISSIIHESFHSFQAEIALERVRSAESANTFASSYPWKNPDFREAWHKERMILGTILKTPEEDKFRSLTIEWLRLREQRRGHYNDSKLTNYEQEREWLEGLAKYAEVRSWLLASDPTNYQPLAETSADPDFDHYSGGKKNRNREIKQLQSDLNFNDTIFYYSGWAQAEILDRLDPNWKLKAFQPSVYLDDLIRENLNSLP